MEEEVCLDVALFCQLKVLDRQIQPFVEKVKDPFHFGPTERCFYFAFSGLHLRGNFFKEIFAQETLRPFVGFFQLKKDKI